MQTITVQERGHAVSIRTTLITEECCQCGTVFAFAEELRNKCLESRGSSGRQFYCPNGHPQHYTGRTDAERLESERDRTRRELERVRDQRDHAEARRRGQLAATTRLKKRIAHGVCPCCKRSFKDLGRHMAGQHPDFAPNDPTS